MPLPLPRKDTVVYCATPDPEIYTLSLHDALPILRGRRRQYRDAYCEDFRVCVELDGQAAHPVGARWRDIDRKSTRLNSSHRRTSYAVFCMKEKEFANSEREALTIQRDLRLRRARI